MTIKVDNDSTSVTFTCMAYEALSYYWERETGDIPLDAVGINTNTLTLHNILPPDSGRYRCVADNEHGITYSNYAVLTVGGKIYMQMINPFYIFMNSFSSCGKYFT